MILWISVAFAGSALAPAADAPRLAALGFAVGPQVGDRVVVHGDVAREPALDTSHPRLDFPDLVVAREMQLTDLYAAGPDALDGYTGRGIVLGDLDSGVDLFDPDLFFGDGGVYAWIDVDKDGLFTPGFDAVDLDGNGQADPGEILSLGDVYTTYASVALGHDVVTGRGTAYEADHDYLFVDSNGDGAWNAGAGFSEDTPAYGEPIFYADDANGDGWLEPSEKLVRLGHSKIRAIWTPGHIYERGVDLVAYDGRGDHATQMLGVAIGGQSVFRRNLHGLLPDAEAILVPVVDVAGSPLSTADIVDGAEWLKTQSPTAVAWEFDTWAGLPRDGSTALDAAVDDLSANAPQVCAAGNLGAAGKHAVGSDLAMTVPADVPDMALDLSWTGAAPTCTLTGPDGSAAVAGTTSTSSRGLTVLTADVLAPAPGAWSLACTGAVDVLETDAATPGVRFDAPTAAGTLTIPGTADSCITVAAYGAQIPVDLGPIGSLRPTSSRGPRIDGGRTIDVAAPDDAFGPVAQTTPNEWAFPVTSGTSAAAAHAAAAVAVLARAAPGASSAQIRTQLESGAGTAVDDGWGYGKARAWDALFGSDPPYAPITPIPVAIVTDWGPACEVEAFPFAEGVPDAVFRWDVGYDGTWDGPFIAGPVVLPVTPALVRVEAARGPYWLGGLAVELDAPTTVCTAGDTSYVDDTAPTKTTPHGCHCDSGAPPSGSLLALLALALLRRRGFSHD